MYGYYLTVAGCGYCPNITPNCSNCDNAPTCIECDLTYFLNGANHCEMCDLYMADCLYCFTHNNCS